MQDALKSCDWVAAALQCELEEILPFSTGVIGELMPMPILDSGIKKAAQQLSVDGWMLAAPKVRA